MKELITVKYSYHEMINQLTITIDSYIKKPIKGFYTYIYDTPYNNDTWLIRYPGSTIGNIKVDENNIIKSIRIYHDVVIYSDDVREQLDSFIGRKMIIKRRQQR